MFSLEDKVFSHKNAISKNTHGKTSYLPKAGYYYFYEEINIIKAF